MKSLRFNFIMNMFLTVSNFLFPLLTFPYISRVLEADGVGKIAFFSSVVTYFAMLAQLGIPTYGIRACAKVRNDKEKLAKTTQEIFFINFIMSVFSYVLLFITYLTIDKFNEEGILFLVLASSIAFNLIGMEWLYKALEEYVYISIRSFVFKVASIILMFLFVKDSDDYILYGMITIVATSLYGVLNLYNLTKYINFYKVRTNYNLKQHIKPIITLFSLSAAIVIYSNLDSVMLGFIFGDEAVGYYNTSVRVKFLLLSIVASLGMVLLPRLSFYIQNGEREKFLKLSNRSFKFTVLLALSMTTYFIIYSKEVIYFLTGDSFKESILPMQIILPTVVFIGITNLLGLQILVPLGKEKLVAYSAVIGAVVNVLLNWWLIPMYSYVGTAVANLVAEFVVLLVQMYFIRDVLKDIVKGTNYFSMGIALVLASLVSLVSVRLFNGDFYILVTSSLLFFGVYFIVLRFFRNEFILEIESIVMKKIKL